MVFRLVDWPTAVLRDTFNEMEGSGETERNVRQYGSVSLSEKEAQEIGPFCLDQSKAPWKACLAWTTGRGGWLSRETRGLKPDREDH